MDPYSFFGLQCANQDCSERIENHKGDTHDQAMSFGVGRYEVKILEYRRRCVAMFGIEGYC
jgi:hypothetical protein